MPGRSAPKKGKEAELEVVRLWRDNGWPKARRQPGSGGWRPYGPGDAPEMPLDVGGVDPFLVSVKCDRKLLIPQRGTGILGAAFAARALREVVEIAGRRPVGSQPLMPVLFGRPAAGEGSNGWRVWWPAGALVWEVHRQARSSTFVWDGLPTASEFVEIPWWAFFPLIGTEEDWRRAA